MKAIQMKSFGGPEVLEYVDTETPELGENEVLVRIHASGVNPAETYIRTGNYSFFKPELPYIPGTDAAGVVEKVGKGVDHLMLGDRVFVAALMAEKNTGTYAERGVFDKDAVNKLPFNLTFPEGAALGVPFMAAYRALVQRAKIKRGETVLIHGASGGVGLLAVQIAKTLGAYVIATAGSKEGINLVKSVGANEVYDHSKEGYIDQILDEKISYDIHVVLEMLANKNLENDLKLISKYGRIVIIGNRGNLDFNPRLTMEKEADIMGMAVWNSTPEENQESLKALVNMVNVSSINPRVDKEYPLYQVSKAHEEIIDKKSKGKVVLTMV
jgi:NADPH2:quinone reductase